MDACIGAHDMSPTDGQRGIRLVCERGHEQWLLTPQYGEPEARSLAGLLDGSHPLYVVKPRDVDAPGSSIGRCQVDPMPDDDTPHPLCGAWIAAGLFGYAQ
jgi:hypothetical protein